MKRVVTTVPLCPTNGVHHFNHNEHNMKLTDIRTNNDCAHLDPKIHNSHALTRVNFSSHHRQGEVEALLQHGRNEYWESCRDATKVSCGELYSKVGSYSNSTSLHMVKHSDKVLSNITTTNNNITLHNNNTSKHPSSISGSTWNYCSINMQEKQNMHSENIFSNLNLKTKTEDLSFSNSFARVDCHVYEEKGKTSCNYSCHTEMNKEKQEKSEYPVNVQILKKNWNILETAQNPSSSRKEIINKNQTFLHNNIQLPQHIPVCNSSEIHPPWKPESQLLFNQHSCNQVHQGNPSTITLQKRDQQNMQCHDKFSNDISENGKIIRIHSFRLNTDPAKSTLPCNTKCHSPVSSGSIFTNNDAGKIYNENDGNQPKISDTECSHEVTTRVNKTKDVMKLLPFSVVHKKLKWPCTCCGVSQATRLSLITHIKSHLLPWCKICLKVINSKDQLISHMEKKHSSSDVEVDQPETQFVTSKYGRRRRVYSPATLLPKRKCDIKK